MRLILIALIAVSCSVSTFAAESDPVHQAKDAEKPEAWPGGIIPYDLSKLTADQEKIAKLGMQRWMETGAGIHFVPRSNQVEYIFFTGRVDAGNNTSHVGFHKGHRTDINISAFWWKQGEWMPVHELGHVLGFFHEHARWDRDQYVTIHYENIKDGRAADYDWIPADQWIVSSTAYDYYSIMHYRVCWAGRCEPECKDGDGSSPCAVIDPVGTHYDKVIGQWGDNKISAMDALKARLVYGTNAPAAVKTAGSEH